MEESESTILRGSVRKLGLREASAVIALSNKRFLVADDEEGIFLSAENLLKPLVRHKKKKRDVEGICLSRRSRHVYAVSEASRCVTCARLRGRGVNLELVERQELGKLPKISAARNKGWEGIDIVPGTEFPDGRERLIAVNQRPKRVGIFSLPDLYREAMLKLPSGVRKDLRGLNDVAVCPLTGSVVVLSGKSHMLVALRLDIAESAASGERGVAMRLAAVRRYSFEKKRRERPEGLAFAPDGKLWLVTEGRGLLKSLALDSTAA